MNNPELSEKTNLTCSLCKEVRSIKHFYLNSNGSHDLRCKQCQADYKAALYKKAKSKLITNFNNKKCCKKCGIKQSFCNFPIYPLSKDGVANTCWSCKNNLEKLNINPDKFWWRRSCILSRSKTGKVSGKNLKYMFELQNRECLYCGIPLTQENLNIEHKTPLSRKGLTKISNLSCTCFDCNQLKGIKTHEEFLIFLQLYIQRILSMSTRTEGHYQKECSGAEHRDCGNNNISKRPDHPYRMKKYADT